MDVERHGRGEEWRRRVKEERSGWGERVVEKERNRRGEECQRSHSLSRH